MDVNFNSDPGLLADFILQARGHLATVAARSGWLERNPSNAAALYGIWRSFYSIKCLASFLGLSSLAEVAYKIETSLLPARTGDLTISPEQARAISEASNSLEYHLITLTTELV
jgi:two-component system, chemotaxis family, sensor kinase CheA